MSSPERERSLLIMHGAGIILLGLLAGFMAVVEELAGSQPTIWRASHGALLLAGVWLLASGPVLPTLVLPEKQRRALCWSLLVTGYAFTSAVLIQAITGVRALSPHGSLWTTIAYVANIVTPAAGVVAAVLTVSGARGALRGRA